MPYQIIIPKPVVKQLDFLPSTVRDPVLKRIADLKEAPRPRGCVKLKGYEGEFRIRIGDYRIRYLVDDGQSVVVILHCLHRREAYRK
ncbi:type II toxin-antitoxin system RelE/ParE family toxin [bacterium]|nr:MAG: type II toxin-antitoxin system RelE/ParE family toxin [bacterium]